MMLYSFTAYLGLHFLLSEVFVYKLIKPFWEAQEKEREKGINRAIKQPINRGAGLA